MQSLFGVLEEKGIGYLFTSGKFVIEVNTISNNNQWVLDTSCSSHICTNVQGLRNSRQLNKGQSDPSGRILSLEDCYYVPSLTKNIVSFLV